jgi:hypothetical protein
MTIYLPAAQAGQLALGDEARMTLDPFPAQHKLSFCFMPPESLPAGRLSKGSRLVALSNSSM